MIAKEFDLTLYFRLGPIALRTEELLNDKERLIMILEKGNQNARSVA